MLEKISDVEWEIPASYLDDMQVPVRIFATREILEQIADDRSLEQAVNSTTLPGLVGRVYVMPDMHQGYGFPIDGEKMSLRASARGDARVWSAPVVSVCEPVRWMDSPRRLRWLTRMSTASSTRSEMHRSPERSRG